MAYNITYNITGIDTSNAAAYYSDVNTILQGIPAFVLLLVVYVGIFAAYVNNDVTRAHIAASAATTGVSILLFFMGMLAPEIIMYPVSLLVVGLIVLGVTD